MDVIFRYFRLLQREVGQMSNQMDGEMAGLLACLVIAFGWFFLRGHTIKL